MAGAAASVTMVSYVDHAHIGVNIDPAAIPDPAVFRDCLAESFDEVQKLA